MPSHKLNTNVKRPKRPKKKDKKKRTLDKYGKYTQKYVRRKKLEKKVLLCSI